MAERPVPARPTGAEPTLFDALPDGKQHAPMSEAQLQSAVLEMAKLFSWRCAHFRTANTTQGWMTPVAADGKGFPDLCMVRDRVVFAELKAERGTVAPEQTEWARAILNAGLEMYLWRPRDWRNGTVEAVLR